MDKKTQAKMNDAMKKAQEAQEFQEKAKDISNLEFWESHLKDLKFNRQQFLNNLGETNFLIEKYLDKIAEIRNSEK